MIAIPSTPTQEGQRAARLARDQLGIDTISPLPDLVVLTEEVLRIPVTLLRLPDGVAGAFARDGKHSFVFLSSQVHPARRRFTLAHEVGHHVMGHAGRVDAEGDVFGRPRRPEEVAANAFAATLLSPPEAVLRWLEARGNPDADLEVVIRLAAYFGISAQSARYRLEGIGALPRARDRAALDADIQRGGHLELARELDVPESTDSLSLDRVPLGTQRVPTSLLMQAERAYAAGLLGTERLAELLAIDPGVLVERFASRRVMPVDDPDY